MFGKNEKVNWYRRLVEGFMLSRGLELIAKEVEGLKAKVSDLEQGVK